MVRPGGWGGGGTTGVVELFKGALHTVCPSPPRRMDHKARVWADGHKEQVVAAAAVVVKMVVVVQLRGWKVTAAFGTGWHRVAIPLPGPPHHTQRMAVQKCKQWTATNAKKNPGK